jgi:type II secretory pathway component PulJ
MLVALTMIAMIVSIVYVSYAATSQSLRTYNSRQRGTQRAELALRLMARQIRCAYAPAEPNRPQTSDEMTSASIPVFAGSSQSGTGEILTLLTTAGLAGDPAAAQRLSMAQYRFDRSSTILAIRNGRTTDKNAAPRWLKLLDGVKRIDLAFHDGRQWLPQWDYDDKQQLPHAVRIALTIIAEDGREYDLETTASIGYRTAASERNL